MPLFDERLDEDISPQDVRDREAVARLEQKLEYWQTHPVEFVCEVLGAQPETWQCDVMETMLVEDSIAVRACHGVGKTTLLSWIVLWFIVTRKNAIVLTTAPTYNKQVRDVLWGGGIHKWYEKAVEINPWIKDQFELTVTRMHHKEHKATWYAVGVASGKAMTIEGYHEANFLVVFDEAKIIPETTWDSVAGMRTTEHAKHLVVSTPGGKTGEFFKIFDRHHETWPATFIIHPECLRSTLKRPESPPYSRGGTYYSKRIPESWVDRQRKEWGTDSWKFISRCIGDFPDVSDMRLIPYEWIRAARSRTSGIEGDIWISCDVARSGVDRTVVFVGKGGTVIDAEVVSQSPDQTTAQELKTFGIGKDPKRPWYRSTVATVAILQRMRLKHGAVGIIVDEGTFGAGIVDRLKELGERVVAIAFGGSPTDRPTDPEARAAKRDKHLIDSHYANIKAEMGWHIRGAFENGLISLSHLPEHVVEPLMEQCSLVEVSQDAAGRLKLVDPDEQDEIPDIAGEEYKKSPDHFHALMLLWWAVSGFGKDIKPRSGALNLPSTITQLGQAPERAVVGGQAVTVRRQNAPVAGQAAWIATRFR